MSRKILARAIAAAAVLVLAVLTWGAWAAVHTRDDVAAARQALTRVRASGSSIGDVQAALTAAHERLATGRQRMNQPGPRIAARLPIVGRSYAAVRHTAAAADSVVEASRTILVSVDVTTLLVRGGFDLATLERMRASLTAAAAETSTPLQRLRDLRTGWTPGSVQNGVAEARRELGSFDTTLREAGDLVDALAAIAGRDKPQRMLIALQNNAELRGTGGLISIFAEGTTDKGRLTLEGFRDVEDVAKPPAEAKKVAAPVDFERLYGDHLANSTLWKNTNMSPDGPSSWGVLANVAEVSLARKPDLIIVIDVPAVAQILGAIGPAELPDGRTIRQDNVVSELLEKAYANIPDTYEGQTERRRRLRVAADAVIRRLLTASGPPLPLFRALQRASTGRHLMVWSADPARQKALVDSGVAGAVPTLDPDIAMMTVHNLGSGRFNEGNKLDYYSERAGQVAVTVGRDYAETTQRWTLRNAAPPGLSDYVEGRQNPGRTNNEVWFAVPPDAQILGYDRDGVALPTAMQSELGHRLLTDIASLDRGASTTWSIRYRVPLAGRSYGLWLVPQPTTRPATLSLRISAAADVDIDVQDSHGGAYDGPWTDVLHRGVGLPGPSRWERITGRVKRWWDEPVHVG
ncbi:MAG: DUF4012 domain-containing protein [Mycobacteriales bacterium]